MNSESSLRRIVSTVRWLSPFGILCKRPNEALLKRWLELFRFLSCIDMTLFDGDFLMPLIHFAGETIGCSRADNLRSVLMRQEPSMRGKLYNDAAGLLHCRGLGTCGTCAVEVQGELTPATKVERWRLGFSTPPIGLWLASGMPGLRDGRFDCHETCRNVGAPPRRLTGSISVFFHH